MLGLLLHECGYVWLWCFTQKGIIAAGPETLSSWDFNSYCHHLGFSFVGRENVAIHISQGLFKDGGDTVV
jgi:hypothetical protein